MFIQSATIDKKIQAGDKLKVKVSLKVYTPWIRHWRVFELYRRDDRRPSKHDLICCFDDAMADAVTNLAAVVESNQICP